VGGQSGILMGVIMNCTASTMTAVKVEENFMISNVS